MAEQPTVFGPKATEQIAKTVREVSRRMMLPRGERGRWQFHGGGGGGSWSIWFTIDEVLCQERDYVDETILVVTVNRHTGPCGTEAPGADSYGLYHVYAFCENDLAGLTEEDLLGTKGKATYDPSDNECAGKYLIDFLCAQPECP